ncbi:ABC transporter permease [Streptomyces sp. NPDC059076]|uniref:ABC transporter permease n=1 Tax=unclassified Streptomyces TaxID=2593676 RepID=UPI00368B4D04
MTDTTASALVARRQEASQRLTRWAIPTVFAVLVAVAAATTSDFLTFDNLRGVLINTAVTGIAAVGMTTITLSGNLFSLGAGQSAMLASILFMWVASSGGSLALGILLALVVLVAIGLLQSLAVAAGLNPVVTTIAAGALIYGAVAGITGGAVVSAPTSAVGELAAFDLLGIPLPVWVFAAFTGAVWLFVERTTSGRRLLLVGSNRETAVMSGISVRAATAWAFAITSIGLAIAGIFSASQLGQVTANNLSELTVDAVAAVLVGGTAVSGGEGSAVRSAVGALVIVVLQNVLLLHGLPTGVRILTEGILLVAVVSVLHMARRKAMR